MKVILCPHLWKLGVALFGRKYMKKNYVKDQKVPTKKFTNEFILQSQITQIRRELDS